MLEDILTAEVIEHWWIALSATFTAISGGAWLGKQWFVARKAAQIALYVVQIVGRNYVDRWKREAPGQPLTGMQKSVAVNTAVDGLEAKIETLNPILKPMVKKYVAAKTPEAIIEKAVKVDKKNKAKRKHKIGPKGGLR